MQRNTENQRSAYLVFAHKNGDTTLQHSGDEICTDIPTAVCN
jgi:hypothetical protein